MDRFEYFRMKLELFPPVIIDKYSLHDRDDADGNVFCEVCCGMYVLPQARIIVEELLTSCSTKPDTTKARERSLLVWCTHGLDTL